MNDAKRYKQALVFLWMAFSGIYDALTPPNITFCNNHCPFRSKCKGDQTPEHCVEAYVEWSTFDSEEDIP